MSPTGVPTPQETQAEVYDKIGLRCGLEIHQQLLTERKLFCGCPAGPYRGDFDAEIVRHMRATLSEMGEYSGTALMEEKTRKEIVYQITGDTTCTYETDDSPPFEIDPETLDIALEIALLLDTNIVGEMHVARKQYLDGSIPTGFQRTAIVGLDGALPFRGRTVEISQVAIEEDSCREISDRGHVRVFRTDRLSRPLVEIVTGPDLVTPEEAEAVVRLLARAVRSTGRVRTGLGAARQDVNISIAGGTRVEIKGVPRIALIARLVHYEAFRQLALLAVRDRLREVAADRLFRPSRHDAADLATGLGVLGGSGDGTEVALLRLPFFGDVLARPMGPRRRFADELSDQARVVACLDSEPNLLREGDGLASDLFWSRAREHCGAAPEDGLLLLWGPAADLAVAVEEIGFRARVALEGVPGETRQALRNGESRLERVLPGPDQMYPDTDLPPVLIADARLDRLQAGLPEPVWTTRDRLRDRGVPVQDAAVLASSPRRALLERVLAETEFAPSTVSRVLLSPWCADLTDGTVETILLRHAKGEFAREAFPALLRALAAGTGLDAALLDAAGRPVDGAEVRARVREAAAASAGIADPERRMRHLMGLAMATLRGRAPGVEVRRAAEEAVRA